MLELLASEAHKLSLQEIAARVSIPAARGALKRITGSISRSLGWLGRAAA